MASLRLSISPIHFRKDWRSLPAIHSGLATNLGLAIAAPVHFRKTPYQEQWSFDIQRQLPWSIMADIGYTGTHGVALPATVALNQLPMSQLALGTQLTQTVTNPFFGYITDPSSTLEPADRAVRSIAPPISAVHRCESERGAGWLLFLSRIGVESGTPIRAGAGAALQLDAFEVDRQRRRKLGHQQCLLLLLRPVAFVSGHARRRELERTLRTAVRVREEEVEPRSWPP